MLFLLQSTLICVTFDTYAIPVTGRSSTSRPFVAPSDAEISVPSLSEYVERTRSGTLHASQFQLHVDERLLHLGMPCYKFRYTLQFEDDVHLLQCEDPQSSHLLHL